MVEKYEKVNPIEKLYFLIKEYFSEKIRFDTSFELFRCLRNSKSDLLDIKEIIIEKDENGRISENREYYYQGQLVGICEYCISQGFVVPHSKRSFVRVFVNINGMTKVDYFEHYDRFLQSKKWFLKLLGKNSSRYKLFFPNLGEFMLFDLISIHKSLSISEIELNSSPKGFGFYQNILEKFQKNGIINSFSISNNKFIINI